MMPVGNVFQDIVGIPPHTSPRDIMEGDYQDIMEGDYWVIGGVKWVVVGKKGNHLLVARADKPHIDVTLDIGGDAE